MKQPLSMNSFILYIVLLILELAIVSREFYPHENHFFLSFLKNVATLSKLLMWQLIKCNYINKTLVKIDLKLITPARLYLGLYLVGRTTHCNKLPPIRSLKS
jgi:hypothetical protein